MSNKNHINKYNFSNKIINWYEVNGRDFPWRNTSDPYLIAVSEVLLQRTQVNQVLPVYQKIINKYPSTNHLSNARSEDLKKIIKPLGLHRRAIYLIKISQKVITNYKGTFPKCKEDLLSLPGIGHYTANAILSFSYSLPYPIVDSNVIRILNRYFGLGYQKPRPNNMVMQFARKAMDKDNIKKYNYGVLDLSSIICTTKSPSCHDCPLLSSCHHRQ